MAFQGGRSEQLFIALGQASNALQGLDVSSLPALSLTSPAPRPPGYLLLPPEYLDPPPSAFPQDFLRPGSLPPSNSNLLATGTLVSWFIKVEDQ